MERFITGDVVITDFPFTDLSQSKRRPAVVLYPVPNTPNYILCPITSQFKTDPDAALLTLADFSEGGLTQTPSIARPNYLFTLHESRILYRAGHLTEERLAVIRDTIVSLFQRE